MIEYHGWLTLRESPSDSDEEKLPEVVSFVQSFIDDQEFGNTEIGLRYFNGNCQLWLSGGANHKAGDYEVVFGLLTKIAVDAPGSYGMLYVWDDESLELNNEFQAYIVRRGEVHREADTFLSPCVPKIEDDE